MRKKKFTLINKECGNLKITQMKREEREKKREKEESFTLKINSKREGRKKEEEF